ncbi:hypothetical protein AOLI_G00303500 [Acnodon oligacanthus]
MCAAFKTPRSLGNTIVSSVNRNFTPNPISMDRRMKPLVSLAVKGQTGQAADRTQAQVQLEAFFGLISHSKLLRRVGRIKAHPPARRALPFVWLVKTRLRFICEGDNPDPLISEMKEIFEMK